MSLYSLRFGWCNFVDVSWGLVGANVFVRVVSACLVLMCSVGWCLVWANVCSVGWGLVWLVLMC